MIAAFYEHPSQLPSGLLDEVTRLALDRLEQSARPCERYFAVCYLRLADAVPAAARAAILERLQEDARQILDLDPTVLAASEFQPWWLAESRDAPLAVALRAEIELSLDGEIARQHDDGYWEPRWSWGPEFPGAWQRARSELLGSETLRTLLALRGWGRIETR